MAKPYSELVTQAEGAVAGVKDAELRRVAFERVLNDLMSNVEDHRASKRHSPRPPLPRPSRGVTRPRGGPRVYVEEMIDDSFFKKPRTISEVKAELENRGHHIPVTSLSGPLQKLCQDKRLRRQKPDGKTFSYSNW